MTISRTAERTTSIAKPVVQVRTPGPRRRGPVERPLAGRDVGQLRRTGDPSQAAMAERGEVAHRLLHGRPSSVQTQATTAAWSGGPATTTGKPYAGCGRDPRVVRRDVDEDGTVHPAGPVQVR